MSYAPIVYHHDSFYVFGGKTRFTEKTIGRLDIATQRWSKAGELNRARYGHGVIYDGEVFIVAGGIESVTESCSLDNDSITCVDQLPKLDMWHVWPEMHLVPSSYCKQVPCG